MPDQHANFAVSTLANAPGTGGTSFTVSSGEGSRFPTPPFNATVWPAGVQANPSNAEIVRVTAIASDTLTVTRNANFLTGDLDKGGTAQNVAIGWQIAATITKKTLFDIENPLSIMQKLGSMTFMGHSYVAGSTQNETGTPNVYKESTAAKLMAMLNIHEHNVYHLAQSATALALPANYLSASTFGGWLTALQYFWPHNSAAVNSASDLVLSDPISASLSGALTIVHGHNDLMLGSITGANQALFDEAADVSLRAGKEALRTIISRFRAGVVYAYVYPNGGGALTMDSSVAFGETWAGPTASVILNSGAGYNHTVDWTGTTGNFTITIPATFTGGTVAVCLIAQEGGCSYITGGVSGGGTSITVANREYFPASGTFPIRILAEGANAAEDLLVTAGHGSGSGAFTVQAIGGGGMANAHGANAVVRSARNMHRVAWGGTATLETGSDISESSDGTVANVVTPDGTGITYLSGKGNFGKRVAITTRFQLTAASAGATITGSMTGRFNTNDSAADMRFDSWWIEDSDPPPTVMTNIQDFYFNMAAVRGDTATVGQRPITTYIPNWNAMLEDVASEFQDGFVRVADVWTPFHNRNGTIGTTMTAVEASPTSISWTPYDSTFVPKKGMRMFFGGGTGLGGFIDESEAVIIAADPVYVGPHWTLSLTRAADGTTQRAHTSGDWLGAADWMYTGAGTADAPYDFIHLNQRGHAVFAEKIYQTFADMPEPSTYQLAEVVGNWSQNSQQISMGIVDDYLYPCPSSGTLGAAAAIGINTQWAVPVYIPKLSVCTKISYQVGTGIASGVVRMGIFMPDLTHARPGRLLTDFGTAATTGAGEEIGPTGYQVLHPGWYWISGVNQTAAASTRNLPIGGQPVAIPIPSGTAITANAVALGVTRGSITSQATFDAQWTAWTYPLAANTIPKMWLRLRTVNFA